MDLGLPVGPVAALPWPVGGRLPWEGEIFDAFPEGGRLLAAAAISFSTAASASAGVGGTLGRPATGMSGVAFAVGGGEMGSCGTPAV